VVEVIILSTFSFRKYLATILFTFIFACSGYFCLSYLPIFRFGGGVGNTDWQNCQIRAQRYLYDLKDPEVVIIGSSMSGRIRHRLMGDHVYNMAYPCILGLTALEIIEAKKEKPKVLIVQLHQILNSDQDMKDVVLSPFWNVMRRHIRSLRQEFRPSTIFKFLITEKLSRLRVADDWFLPSRIDLATGRIMAQTPEESQALIRQAHESKGAEGLHSDKIGVAMLDDFKAHYGRLFDSSNGRPEEKEEFTRKLAELKRHFESLEKAGTKIVLNQMPIAKEFEALPVYQYFVTQIKAAFPKLQYLNFNSDEFRLPDGLHMDDRSALLLTEMFINEHFDKVNK
jgi:hypothetical protein